MQFIGSKWSFEECDVVVLPVPYEKTVSYMPGTAKGPRSIINASMQLESFDMELGYEIDKRVKIHTTKEMVYNEIEKNVLIALNKNKFPVLLGGEHTITVPAVKACAKLYQDLSVLQIDAHADLRDEFDGERYSHACVMRRVRETVKRTVQVGIRDMSAEENEYIEKEGIRNTIYGIDFDADEIIRQLSDNVYITVDLDGLDPSECPAVGTPQPGGLHWKETVGLLRKITEKKNVVGFDVVELAPVRWCVTSDFLAAKLVYKMIGYCTSRNR